MLLLLLQFVDRKGGKRNKGKSYGKCLTKGTGSFVPWKCVQERAEEICTPCVIYWWIRFHFFLCSHLSPSLFPHMSTVVSQHAPTSSLFVPSHLSSLFRENPSRILAIVSNTVQCCCDIMFGMDRCRLPHW